MRMSESTLKELLISYQSDFQRDVVINKVDVPITDQVQDLIKWLRGTINMLERSV